VWGFGSNEYGQLGLNSKQNIYLTPTQLKGFKAVQVTAGFDYTLMTGTSLT